MAKYYFLIGCVIYGIYGHSQDCNWTDLLYNVDQRWGTLELFQNSEEGFKLNDAQANKAILHFMTLTPARAAQFIFSLDFPPSEANQFQIEIDLYNTNNTDSARIVLSVGESGDQDGVMMSYYSGGQLIREDEFWPGYFGEGVENASWTFRVHSDGMVFRNSLSDADQLIAWEDEEQKNFYIHEISLRCIYTKTRSTNFTFHHLYVTESGNLELYDLIPGDLFLSEYRIEGSVEYYFIEIYNSLTESRCITGLRIQIDDFVLEIPPLRIDPGIQLLLVDSTTDIDVAQTVYFKPVKFPLLTGSGIHRIRLLQYDRLIHSVWSSENISSGKNVSWEMVDVTQPCRFDNWKESSIQEGTPGRENSWFSTLPSSKLGFVWTDFTSLQIAFPYMIFDYDQLGQIIWADHPFTLEYTYGRGVVTLRFENSLPENDSMEVKVQGILDGCSREEVQWDTTFVSLPPRQGENERLLFTEIMYDPPHSCPEYLEISNIENKNSWWKDLWIQNYNGQRLKIDVPFEWPGGESRLITGNKELFVLCYEESDAGVVYESDLFALSNGGGALTLSTEDSLNHEIDRIIYEPSDQNELFKEAKGVALERNIHEPGGNKWRSGFVQFGYRSPGFIPEWDLDPNIDVIFSTYVLYSQGRDEKSGLNIEIRNPGVDASVTIEIYDINGRKVQVLVDAVPLQGGEIFRWKGRKNSGQLLPEGLYLFWIYYFDVEGRKRIFKRTCVLSNN